MAILVVRITPELAAKVFRTGNVIPQCRVEQGLPADAVLIRSGLQTSPDPCLVVEFETADGPAGERREVSVVLTREPR